MFGNSKFFVVTVIFFGFLLVLGDCEKFCKKKQRKRALPETTTTTTSTTTTTLPPTTTTTTTTATEAATFAEIEIEQETTTRQARCSARKKRPSKQQKASPSPHVVKNNIDDVRKIKKMYAEWQQNFRSRDNNGTRSSFLLKDTASSSSSLKTFAENVRKIEEHNKLFEEGKVPFKVGMNEFTDQTLDQLKLKLGIRALPQDGVDNPEALKPVEKKTPRLLQLPSEINWANLGGIPPKTYVTPVKSQENCASCYAFGAIATLEAHYSIRHKGQLVSFSEQEVLDCTFYLKNKGCSNGRLPTVYQYVAENGGLCTENSYPYRMSADSRMCDARRCRDRRKIRLAQPYYRRIESLNTQEMMTVIAQDGPIACEFSVQDEFVKYAGGVYVGEPKCNTPEAKLDHVMLIVGYGRDMKTGMKFWILKNSWSTKWGVQGYIWIERGRNVCGIETSCRYPLMVADDYAGSTTGGGGAKTTYDDDDDYYDYK